MTWEDTICSLVYILTWKNIFPPLSHSYAAETAHLKYINENREVGMFINIGQFLLAFIFICVYLTMLTILQSQLTFEIDKLKKRKGLWFEVKLQRILSTWFAFCFVGLVCVCVCVYMCFVVVIVVVYLLFLDGWLVGVLLFLFL